MKEYWNDRFVKEGLIWGNRPSQTAEHAREIFIQHQVKMLLVPGAGYGRNTKILSPYFTVDAIEISREAVELGRNWDVDSHFLLGDVLETSFKSEHYDAVYGFDLLQLFRKDERVKLIQKCLDSLVSGGLYYFTCFSDKDEACGQGMEIEPSTYEYKPGKIAHFFSEDDLEGHFEHTQIIEMGEMEERFTYTDHGTRDYKLRYIVGMKV